ncbi:MAG: amidohydrolase [Bacteroidetes bacterium]|nr:amidohydrolase [Bacteroidota bacterium]
MSKLTITTIQSSLYWEDIDANLNMFTEKLSHFSGETDLIILPEMFTTGFSMDTENVSETMEGKSVNWMRSQAKDHNAALMGSLIIKDNGKCYNRLVCMYPSGEYVTYDKRHLFTLAKEHEYFQAGKEKLVFEYKGWKICPLICYDLRFPVWSRNTEDYDLLVYMANWPATRNHHWKTLLMARAIENQSYCVGVNRVGKDKMDLYYSGDTTVIDFTGNLIYQVANTEDIFTTTLSKEKMDAFRSKLNFLPDRDTFEIMK